MSRKVRARAQERRSLLEAATRTVKELSKEELINIRFELGREFNQQNTVLGDLSARLEAVTRELKGREEVWDGYRITDHAVVRYLERYRGVDVDAIRREIAKIANSARGADFGRRRHEETGATLGVDERDGFKVVTTIFREEELAVIKLPGEATRLGQKTGET